MRCHMCFLNKIFPRGKLVINLRPVLDLSGLLSRSLRSQCSLHLPLFREIWNYIIIHVHIHLIANLWLIFHSINNNVIWYFSFIHYIYGFYYPWYSLTVSPPWKTYIFIVNSSYYHMWRLLIVFSSNILLYTISTLSIDKIIVFFFFGLWMVLYNQSESETNCDILPEAASDI